MRFEFKTKKLEQLYINEKNAHHYPQEVVTAFFEVIASIESALNENDLRTLKSLHFEKLSGKRNSQHSLRLNKQYRLIIELIEDEFGKIILIIEIIDYHK